VDILPRAACTLLGQRRAVVIKLQRDAHHVIALVLQHRRHDRGIDAARHGDDDPRVGGGLGQAKRIQGQIAHRFRIGLKVRDPQEYRKIAVTHKAAFHRLLNQRAHSAARVRLSR
jgi:hypothetical protein